MGITRHLADIILAVKHDLTFFNIADGLVCVLWAVIGAVLFLVLIVTIDTRKSGVGLVNALCHWINLQDAVSFQGYVPEVLTIEDCCTELAEATRNTRYICGGGAKGG